MSRRGENIRKRKDGRWEGRYIKGYDSKKQKARYASVYGKTYAETKQKLDEAKYKSSIGVVYVDAKNKLFGEIINSWFNAKKINLKPSSIIKYQNLIEKHILPELGHRKLRELNADLFYTFLDAQQKNGNKKNGGMLSTSSLQTMLYILNATIKYAASNNMVAYFSICLTRSGKEDEGDAVMYILEKLDDDLKFLTQLGVECQMSISPTGSLVLKENEPSAKTHPRFELSFGSQDNEILFSFNECCYKYHPGLFKDAYLEFLSKEGADH